MSANQLQRGDHATCYQRVDGLEPPFRCVVISANDQRAIILAEKHEHDVHAGSLSKIVQKSTMPDMKTICAAGPKASRASVAKSRAKTQKT